MNSRAPTRVQPRLTTPHSFLALAAVLVSLACGCAFGPKPRGPGGTGSGGANARPFVYVGTSAGNIEIVELDAATGSLIMRGKVSMGGSPVALAGLPFGKTLVAIDEHGNTFLYELDAAGAKQVGKASTGGSRPGRTALDHTGKYVLVTNQASASIGVLALRPSGGLAPPDLFPAGAGAYGLAMHPSNRVVFVANTKAGTLSQLSFNEGTGTLTAKPGAAIGLPWGSGPRAVGCHPSGRFIYVLNETNSTISVHTFDDRMGTVTRLAFQVISTLPPDVPTGTAGKNRAVELALGVSGRYVYALNRGADDLVTFAVDPETGSLSFVSAVPSGGSGAVALGVDPAGRRLVVGNQSKHVASFAIDEKTGAPVIQDSKKMDGAVTAAVVLRPPME
jgi:6-phosphogluconolactonase